MDTATSPLDPFTPGLRPLNELARELPQRLSPPTLWRWASNGRNGVRLSTIKIGRTVYTTREEFSRFLIESSQPNHPEPIPAEQHEATESELRRIGYLSVEQN